ncbi:hypothetical protein P154DRAFT_574371 [Amniculicola lignicola CBS 123094]|uniref:Uncharacterized protein n=1 Tax=Amniculicola lignicola CBS 123094 TaxID=1392246 RepID=A0A6A5WK61_9PLEO|nr:hypothetical protein P154DRAFT_574371 [Amniculicola lignicola CBS 123094]
MNAGSQLRWTSSKASTTSQASILKTVSRFKTRFLRFLDTQKQLLATLWHIVFSEEMKKNPKKLSTSGWDIGKVKAHPTTGFSRTNGSQHVLLLGVTHLDLPMQKHPNALMLSYLSQGDNSVQSLPPREAPRSKPISRGAENSTSNALQEPSDAEHLLNIITVMSPPT